MIFLLLLLDTPAPANGRELTILHGKETLRLVEDRERYPLYDETPIQLEVLGQLSGERACWVVRGRAGTVSMGQHHIWTELEVLCATPEAKLERLAIVQPSRDKSQYRGKLLTQTVDYRVVGSQIHIGQSRLVWDGAHLRAVGDPGQSLITFDEEWRRVFNAGTEPVDLRLLTLACPPDIDTPWPNGERVRVLMHNETQHLDGSSTVPKVSVPDPMLMPGETRDLVFPHRNRGVLGCEAFLGTKSLARYKEPERAARANGPVPSPRLPAIEAAPSQ